MDCHGLRERPWTTRHRSSQLLVLKLPYPHQSAVRGVDRLRELRPALDVAPGEPSTGGWERCLSSRPSDQKRRVTSARSIEPYRQR